jgi:hypothetical protein
MGIWVYGYTNLYNSQSTPLTPEGEGGGGGGGVGVGVGAPSWQVYLDAMLIGKDIHTIH